MADELIYERALSDDSGPAWAIPYQVIKRTKTRIYVHYEIYHEASRAYWDAHPEQRRCFTLDRATFEREGRAYAPRVGETFYATEEAAAPQTLFLQ
jgi:hypothetical protein